VPWSDELTEGAASYNRGSASISRSIYGDQSPTAKPTPRAKDWGGKAAAKAGKWATGYAAHVQKRGHKMSVGDLADAIRREMRVGKATATAVAKKVLGESVELAEDVKFRVGDKVKINKPGNPLHGKTKKIAFVLRVGGGPLEIVVRRTIDFKETFTSDEVTLVKGKGVEFRKGQASYRSGNHKLLVLIDGEEDKAWSVSVRAMTGTGRQGSSREYRVIHRAGHRSDYDETFTKMADVKKAVAKRAKLGEGLSEAKKVDDYPWHRSKRTGEVTSHQKRKIGRLGLVSYEQAMDHERAGKPTHAWGFHASYQSRYSTVNPRGRSISEAKCDICGKTREHDAGTGKVLGGR